MYKQTQKIKHYKTTLFWAITQPVVVISYRTFRNKLSVLSSWFKNF